VLLFVAGLVLRLAAVYERPTGVLERAPDEEEYLQIARSVARGDGFALNGGPTAYRDMLMPVAAGLLMRVVGESALPMLYLNAVLSLGTAFLLFQLGRRRFGDWIGTIMAGAWLLYPGAIIVSAMFLTETPFVFLWVLALVLFDRLYDGGYRLPDAVVLGVVCGLVMLGRAVGIVVVVSLIIYIVLIRFETAFLVRVRAAAIMAAAAFLVVVPWMTRNYLTVGRFALNTNGGINLFIGNNARAIGSYGFDEQLESLLPPAGAGEAARDRVATRLAFSYMREHPRESLNLWGRKFAHFWATDVSELTHYFWNPGGSVRERLRVMPLMRLVLVAAPYILIVLCGVSGFYLVRHFPARGLLLLQVFLLTFVVFLTYGVPRYHLPLIPAMIIGAGALLRQPVWNSAPVGRRLFLLFTLGMFGGIWLFEFMTIAGI